MLIDTHAHTYSEQFLEDLETEIQNSLNEGVKKILLPNVDSDSIQGLHGLVKAHPDVFFPMMGVHPCSVQPDTWQDELETARKLLFESKEHPYVAVGEIGIDLYWDKSTLEIQKEAFGEQIQWAKELKLPIVIHARDSFQEIFEVVDQHNDENLTGVFHCFTGTKEDAQKILDYGGFVMGIGGVLTFKNGGVADVIKDFGLEHFVLETDAPYLAPAPHRGKRNQSSYLPIIAEKMADVFGVSLPEIAEITTANAKRIFKI